MTKKPLGEHMEQTLEMVRTAIDLFGDKGEWVMPDGADKATDQADSPAPESAPSPGPGTASAANPKRRLKRIK